MEYIILKRSEAVDYVIYFINGNARTMKEDKALLVAPRISKGIDVSKVGLNLDVRLNDINFLIDELSDKEYENYKVVYFNALAGKLFIISNDALELLNVYLEIGLSDDRFTGASDALQSVIMNCDFELGIEIIDIKEFE